MIPQTDLRMDMYTLDDLQYLMSRLRDPRQGCPWDLKQTFESIVHHTLEEAYEVADAIAGGNRDEIKDELGDLLFQVIFYAQLGKEEASFNFEGIVDNVVQKLVRRHPHVFPDGDLRATFPEGTKSSDEQIKQQWERIKQEERLLKHMQQNSLGESSERVEFNADEHSILRDVPRNLPSLNLAEKLQKRAAQKGFDWPELDMVLDKLQEEIAELRHELKVAEGKSLHEPEVHARLLDEMGDVLFCCVNVARFVKVNPDAALRSTNQKFISRFHFIEAQLFKRGVDIEAVPLEELDELWERAKDGSSDGITSGSVIRSSV